MHIFTKDKSTSIQTSKWVKQEPVFKAGQLVQRDNTMQEIITSRKEKQCLLYVPLFVAYYNW